MSEPSAPFTWPVRVYWENTDAGAVVYHASYLCFLERARTEWLRTYGLNQHRLREETGLAFAVSSMQLDFLKPARLDDQLLVTVEVESRRAASLWFRQSIHRGEDALLRARVRLACVDLAHMLPVRIPAGLFDERPL